MSKYYLGRLAQLGERCLRMAEVESSNLLTSIGLVNYYRLKLMTCEF